MRAWWLSAGLSLVLAIPVSAATRVSLRELKEHPSVYYDLPISVECYYDKESPIWVSALPEADEWIGFFVTGPPEKALTWSGEYYNLFFAPRTMQDVVRQMRGGDKITVIGQGFHYHSASLDGVGLRVQQILRGWGPSAKAIGEAASASLIPSAQAAPSAAPSAPPAPQPPTSLRYSVEKLAVTINGKRYEGLRYGDRYNFDGVEFQVDPAQ